MKLMFVLGARDLMLSSFCTCINQGSLWAALQSLLQSCNVASPILLQARHLHLNVSQTQDTFIPALYRERRASTQNSTVIYPLRWMLVCWSVFKLCYKPPACLQRSRRICLTQDHRLIYLAFFSLPVSDYFFLYVIKTLPRALLVSCRTQAGKRYHIECKGLGVSQVSQERTHARLHWVSVHGWEHCDCA